MLQIERAHALSDHTVTTEPRIVVMGVSGCGKTTLANALGAAFTWDVLDAIVPGVQFLFLHGAFDAITARMNQREGHYMPSSLLETQFQTLETPGSDEPDVLPISLMLSVEQMVAQLQQRWSP
jgi:gluconate kinase